jgi:hypothetical protein
MATVKYPNVKVRLSGKDGNAFAIIGRVKDAIQREVSREAAEKFFSVALRVGSYDALLQLCMETVVVS